MSKGIGKTQQAILHELETETTLASLSVVDLAERLDASPRQIRTAVHALAGRGLVTLTKEDGGWAGVGQYGPLVDRDTGYCNGDDQKVAYGPEVPTARLRDIWITDYDEDGNPFRRKIGVEQVHIGMPTGVSLYVWLPEKRTAYVEAQVRRCEPLGRALGDPGIGARTLEREQAKELAHGGTITARRWRF